ncbi:MAG: GYF domain-containing protein [Myxococcota bacterium]
MLVKGIGDAADPESSDWYYAIGTERHGPVDRTQLSALLDKQEIGPETYVWHQGMTEWSHLQDVPALERLVGGAPEAERVEMDALRGVGEEAEEVGADTTHASKDEVDATHEALDDVMERSEQPEAEEPEAEQAAEEGPGEETAAETGEALAEEPAEPGEESEVAPAEGADTTMVPQAEIEAAHAQLAGTVEPAGGEATEAPEEPGEEPLAEREGAVLAEDEVAGPDALRTRAGEEPGEPSAGGVGAGQEPEGGDTLFGAAESEAGAGGDLFAGVGEEAPGEAAASTTHGRRETSVLFSLDEVSESEPEQATDPFGEDSLLTESSGLLDIRAVAARNKPAGDESADSPFGEDLGAGLVAPSGDSGAGVTIAAPIVKRKRSNAPKYVAAAAVLLLVGVAGALWWTSQGDEGAASSEPTAEKVAPASAEQPAGAEKAAQPETPPPGEEAAAAAAEEEAAAEGEEEAAAAEGGEAPAEGEEAAAAEGEEEAAAEGEEAAAAAEKQEAAEEPEPEPEPEKVVRKKKARKAAPKPKPEPKKEARAPAPAPKPAGGSGGSKDVNDLLQQLNKKKESKAGEEAADPSLPAKLSAATLKGTLRKRHRAFSACYEKMANRPPGATTVKTSLVIGGNGRVKSARITSGGGTSSDVQSCIVSALRSTTFPKFRDKQMIVNYPIVLR